jgi:hypothetical protein
VATLKALEFLFVAPVIVIVLTVVNLMTWDGQWWVQWAALGIGIAWVFSLLRVLRAIVIAGGLAAFTAYMVNRRTSAL